MKAERDALEREKAELAKEREARAAEKAAEAERAKARMSKNELSLIQELAQERGVEPDVLLRAVLAQYATGGQPTPEEKLSAAEKRAVEAAERAEATAAKLIEDEQKRLRDLEAAEVQAAYEEMVSGFRTQYSNAVSPEKHPYLNALSREEVADRALKAANHYAKVTAGEDGIGLVPPTDELMDFLEKQEREEFEARAERVGWQRAQALKEPPTTVIDTLSQKEVPRISPETAALQRNAGVVGAVTRDSRGKFVSNAAAAARDGDEIDPRDLPEHLRIKRAAQVIERSRKKR